MQFKEEGDWANDSGDFLGPVFPAETMTQANWEMPRVEPLP